MKRIFITGASSGLGVALAIEYAAQGAQCGLLARRKEELESLRLSLPNPDKHIIYAIDVCDHQALNVAAQDFLQRTGGIEVVIANAGVSYGTLTERHEDTAVFEKIMAINVLAVVATFSAFVTAMKSQAKTGQRDLRLVGIASVAGIRGLPGAEAYSSSKAAVISYCESLRVELRASGIKVVTIAPGYIDTPMTQVNTYPMPFLMPANKFAMSAVKKITAGSSYAVIPWQMRGVSWFLRLLPNSLYDLIFARAPYKAAMNEIVQEAKHAADQSAKQSNQ